MIRFLVLTASFLLAVLPAVLRAETVFLKPSEALKIIFHDSQEIVSEKKTKDNKTWTFFIARSGGHVDGYALIDHEVGKTEPITFLTAITPDGKVKAVEILVYRESIGSEVQNKRFLKQYEGKTAQDPVRTGQDINNISGATLSARAVSNGVKRALELWKNFYAKK